MAVFLSKAIYEILNVSPLKEDVKAISPENVTQAKAFPYIMYEQEGEPEDNKDGSGVTMWEVRINIWAEKSKKGNAGITQTQTIADTVNGLMDRFSGTIGGAVIQTIILRDKDSFYDRIAQTARTTLTYRVRENT